MERILDTDEHMKQILDLKKKSFEEAKLLYFHLNKTIRILPPTFSTACRFNNLELAKFIYLIEPHIYISDDDEYIFRNACKSGHLELAKWLLSIKPDIDISIKDEYAFRWACYGHLEVAKWLISIKPDINIDAFHNDDDNEAYADWHDNMDDHEYSEMFDDERNKTAFIKVCESNNLEIAQWLCKLNKKYHIEFKNDNILNYYVL